jgi:hypothetical protein
MIVIVIVIGAKVARMLKMPVVMEALAQHSGRGTAEDDRREGQRRDVLPLARESSVSTNV